MEKLRPVYRDIKDWAILEEKTIYDFSENEHPIEVVEVLIGTLYYDYIDIVSNYHYDRRTPIIRWITRSEFEYLRANEGTVIW